MNYFANCVLCEAFVIGMLLIVLVVAGVFDYLRYKKRGWGENSPDAKWRKR